MIEEGPMTKVEGTSGPILNLSPIYLNIQKELQRIMPKKVGFRPESVIWQDFLH